MHDSVDRRCGGHRVLEDLIPVAEDEIGGYEQGLPLVALSHEREQDFDFLGALADVPDVIEDDQIEVIELAQGSR